MSTSRLSAVKALCVGEEEHCATANSILHGNRRGARVVLALACATMAYAALAVVSAMSEKSYFLDTRCPIVALSDSARLNTTAVGMFILVR